LPPSAGVEILEESIIFPLLSTTPAEIFVPPISIPIVKSELLITASN